jgi:tRNA pseudouridine55 synthase
VDAARLVGHGVPLPKLDLAGPVAVFGPDGTLLSLTENRGDKARHLAVFVG